MTGRRHQIRVHAAHSGHPIVGDNAYSEDRDSFRTFLHAHVLEMPFEPPKGVDFQTPKYTKPPKGVDFRTPKYTKNFCHT